MEDRECSLTRLADRRTVADAIDTQYKSVRASQHDQLFIRNQPSYLIDVSSQLRRPRASPNLRWMTAC